MGTHGFHWISHGGYSMLSDLKICSACFFLCQTKLNSHCHRFTLCLVLPCLSLSLTLCATGIEYVFKKLYTVRRKQGIFKLFVGRWVDLSFCPEPLSQIYSLLCFTVLVTIFECFQSASNLLPVHFQSASSPLPVCFWSASSPFLVRFQSASLCSSLMLYPLSQK